MISTHNTFASKSTQEICPAGHAESERIDDEIERSLAILREIDELLKNSRKMSNASLVIGKKYMHRLLDDAGRRLSIHPHTRAPTEQELQRVRDALVRIVSRLRNAQRNVMATGTEKCGTAKATTDRSTSRSPQ